MALKFLNKKGWHTGSLRNIENVWKAEQKHDAEERKLDELRKQIGEERERSEFRLLQEQAGLAPKQERLEFLYDSGLSVGKGSSDSFKAPEAFLEPDNEIAPSTSAKVPESVPGALFEETHHSTNDAWRKLHSDPLLIIRQREQEALAKVKNNPIQMAMIRKSVEVPRHKEKPSDKDERRKSGHHPKHSSSKHQSNNLPSKSDSHHHHHDYHRHDRISSKVDKQNAGRSDESSERENPPPHHRHGRHYDDSCKRSGESDNKKTIENQGRRRNMGGRLSEEERAARLQEMIAAAEVHEEQRWKRIKKAEEDDAKEAIGDGKSRGGRNFLDAAQKSIFGANSGGSSSIEESVRRRTHYSQGKIDTVERNAFRR